MHELKQRADRRRLEEGGPQGGSPRRNDCLWGLVMAELTLMGTFR